MATSQSLKQAYRDLYKAGLYAVRYSKPSRFVIRDVLREAFRTKTGGKYEQAKIENTIAFLKGAGEVAGIEHVILKNLCAVEDDRRHQNRIRQSVETV